MKLSIVALLFVALAEAASAKWSRGHQESNGSLRGLKGKKDKKGKKAKKGKGGVFNRIAVMPICEGLEDGCEDSTETVAEIVAASDDGMMLVYSDSQLEVLGAVNIEDPENPEHIGVVVSNERKSYFWHRSNHWSSYFVVYEHMGYNDLFYLYTIISYYRKLEESPQVSP